MENENFENSPLYEYKKGSGGKSNAFFWLILCLVFLLVFSLRVQWTNNFGYVKVDGESMETTLTNGEWLVMQYGIKPQRGDVIVVDVRKYKTDEYKDEIVNPFGEKTDFLIKRLMAVEGDSIKCENGSVYIKYAGTKEYVLHPADKYAKDGKTKDFSEYVVGKGEIFFLGDNRAVSRDSRYNEDDNPHFRRLYRESDIYAVVPEWALDNRNWLSWMPEFSTWLQNLKK
ncbi:MAG: signal peptidase I [Clostridia bacterium]|nr:signal peptidase I [Clostridia bacterium]